MKDGENEELRELEPVQLRGASGRRERNILCAGVLDSDFDGPMLAFLSLLFFVTVTSILCQASTLRC